MKSVHKTDWSLSKDPLPKRWEVPSTPKWYQMWLFGWLDWGILLASNRKSKAWKYRDQYSYYKTRPEFIHARLSNHWDKVTWDKNTMIENACAWTAAFSVCCKAIESLHGICLIESRDIFYRSYDMSYFISGHFIVLKNSKKRTASQITFSVIWV